MTNIVLIRHGESETNYKRIFTGNLNPNLTEKGFHQAELASDYIANNYKIDKIYASDLKRAYTTAVPASKRFSLEIIPSEQLREINGGEWQDKTYTDINETYPDAYGLWLNDIGNAVCTGGESVKQLADRVMKKLTEIAEENVGKTVLIATHATPIRAFQTICQHGTLDEMKNVPWVPNSSITIAEYENGRFTLKLIGENSYLNDYATAFPSGNV